MGPERRAARVGGIERGLDHDARGPPGPASVRLRRGRSPLGDRPRGARGRRRLRGGPPQQHGRRDRAGRAHAVRALGLAVLVLAAQPLVLGAQPDIAAATAARGLPVDPLIQKAIEGGAKHVSPDRVIAAVRTLAARLDQAAAALHDGGIATPEADVVEGGADALNAGLSADQVRDLVHASRAPYDPAVTLRVAATLAALGVPPQQAVELVEATIAAGRAPADLLSLPSQVQASVARGATPAQAASGLGRAAAHAPGGRPPREPPPGQSNPHKP